MEIGCLMNTRMITPSKVTKRYGISRSYAYELKDRYRSTMDTLCEYDCKSMILLDKKMIRRSVISLTLDCNASEEGIQRFLELIFNIHVSIGTISNIINEASERAYEFDKTIPLDNIHQAANDEIFQGNQPILTGIDTDSLYAYALDAASDRTGDTWETTMVCLMDQGLDPDVSISDAGTGLMKGIPAAFPKANIQLDVFHALRSVGKEVSKLERSAFSEIHKESELEKRLSGPKPHKMTRIKLEETKTKAAIAIERFDRIWILFLWLKELLGFSGYSYGEALSMANWVLDEMLLAEPDNNGLKKEIESLRKALPLALQHLQQLWSKMETLSEQLEIPNEILPLLYRLGNYAEGSMEEKSINKRINHCLKERRPEVEETLKNAIKATKRASSSVENLNGRIRVRINLKRGLSSKFLFLLKVYFNTKKFRRSRVEERCGKSPLELMTGHSHSDYMVLLGY